MVVMVKKKLVFEYEKKEESKESVYTVWERMIKRHVKYLYRQTFEKQMFEEFRLFLYGAMKILDEQNNFFQIVTMQKTTLFLFSCAKYQYKTGDIWNGLW